MTATRNEWHPFPSFSAWDGARVILPRAFYLGPSSGEIPAGTEVTVRTHGTRTFLLVAARCSSCGHVPLADVRARRFVTLLKAHDCLPEAP